MGYLRLYCSNEFCWIGVNEFFVDTSLAKIWRLSSEVVTSDALDRRTKIDNRNCLKFSQCSLTENGNLTRIFGRLKKSKKYSAAMLENLIAYQYAK